VAGGAFGCDAGGVALDGGPFRGSRAVQLGGVTRDQLRGPRFRRLYTDVFLPVSEPADLAARSRGAVLLAPGNLVLSGYSAAELLGAVCAPAQANAEITVPAGTSGSSPP